MRALSNSSCVFFTSSWLPPNATSLSARSLACAFAISAAVFPAASTCSSSVWMLSATALVVKKYCDCQKYYCQKCSCQTMHLSNDAHVKQRNTNVPSCSCCCFEEMRNFSNSWRRRSTSSFNSSTSLSVAFCSCLAWSNANKYWSSCSLTTVACWCSLSFSAASRPKHIF
jgi:hypothetical protein